ncbi:MAG TPA: phosphatase domain-containing protein [Myxococcota bacterium]|nr:phosphatase domain-containing protein [Myxococcota bacterium]
MTAAPGVAGGWCFRWDLDKTYVYTEFHGVRNLLRTALEKPEEKRTVPGAAALLRALRRQSPNHRIAFISGSPRQMEAVLRAKLKLDGIEPDELVLKPNLENLLRGRFRALSEQVGYKLPALLEARRRTPAGTCEVCFGDDAEMDALIYSMYADILAGRVSTAVLSRVLTLCGAYEDAAAHTVGLACALETGEAVRRIFIHLEGKHPPARFARFGTRLAPIHNYFQAALVLWEDGVLPLEGVGTVLGALFAEHGYDVARAMNSVQDARRRGIVRRDTAGALHDALHDGTLQLAEAGRPARALPALDALAKELERRLAGLADQAEAPAGGTGAGGVGDSGGGGVGGGGAGVGSGSGGGGVGPAIDYVHAIEEMAERKDGA